MNLDLYNKQDDFGKTYMMAISQITRRKDMLAYENYLVLLNGLKLSPFDMNLREYVRTVEYCLKTNNPLIASHILSSGLEMITKQLEK